MEVINPRTKRFVKVGSQSYKRLVREGIIVPEQPDTKQEDNTQHLDSEPETEPEFDESLLQKKMANISTDMIQKNMKKIVKAQKLTDKDIDLLLRKCSTRNCVWKKNHQRKNRGRKRNSKSWNPVVRKVPTTVISLSQNQLPRSIRNRKCSFLGGRAFLLFCPRRDGRSSL